MKNNKILSYLLWLFVAFLGVVYFITGNDKQELKALSETNSVTEKASKHLFNETKLEMEYIVFQKGKSDRETKLLNKIRQHHFLLDTLLSEQKLNWKELEYAFDTLSAWSNKPAKTVLDYKDYSSEKIKIAHQNLFYKLYQRFLMEQKSRFGDILIEFDRIYLGSLDSIIHINDGGYYSHISVLSNLDQLRYYTNSFNFNKSDTIVFEVITDFYRKDTEVKKYRIIAKDKKGVKINSLFDYEEIE